MRLWWLGEGFRVAADGRRGGPRRVLGIRLGCTTPTYTYPCLSGDTIDAVFACPTL